MKVLLDIDGVMIPAKGWKSLDINPDGFPSFSTNSVSGLKRIILSTGASIVLTTSHKNKFSESKWMQIFKNRGIDVKIQKLKSNSLITSRKQEVTDWANTHRRTKFVIIDDDKSLNDLPHNLKERLILTSPLIGLNDSIADITIEKLSTSSF